MRLAASAVLILAVFLGSWVCTTAATNSDYGHWDDEYFCAIQTGALHRTFIMRATWKKYPSFGPPAWPFDIYVLPSALVYWGLAVWLLRLRARQPWLTVGLACLGFGGACYAVGAIRIEWLLNPPRRPGEFVYGPQPHLGFWYGVMLGGLFWALVGCCVFSFLQILKPVTMRAGREEARHPEKH